MQNLLIEQKGPTGLIKTWRIQSGQGTVTFGNSKHADLRSPLDSMKGIQGMFEYRDGKWYFVNLDFHTDLTEFKQGHTDLCLDKPLELRMGVSQLSVTPFETRSQLFSKFDGNADVSTPQAGKTGYQLFVVYQGDKLLQTAVIEPHQTFLAECDTTKTKFSPMKTEKWMKSQIANSVEVWQRTVYMTPAQALMHVTKDQLLDERSQKMMYFTLGMALLLALLSLFTPASEKIEVAAQPLIEYREVVTPPMKKKKMMGEPAPIAESKPTQQESAPAPQQAAAPADNSGGGSKASSVIKSLSAGRLSKLIGKVSATAARSNNVVVTSGVAAGSQPTGRALSAVGAITQSGKDWESEGKGTGIKISTNGVAGGKGVGGMGTLATGKTGSGGVGLLEDEGEIEGGLDRDIIAQYIKSRLGEILYCYERQLSANPDLYGKVAVKFQIQGNGGVDLQRIGETTLKNATVEGCILQKVARWRFPEPKGGTKVLVTYPFLFKSTN